MLYLNDIVDNAQIACNAASQEQIKCSRLHPEIQPDTEDPTYWQIRVIQDTLQLGWDVQHIS